LKTHTALHGGAIMAPSHQTSVVVINDDDIPTTADDYSGSQASKSKPAHCSKYFHLISEALQGTPADGDVTCN